MRHRKKTVSLGRTSQKRGLLIRTLADALIMHEKITTTHTKARVLRSYVERLVTKSKQGTLAAQKNILAKIPQRSVKKLFSELGPRYQKRAGGYTRITKLPNRAGDNSSQSRIEFI